MGTQRLGGSDLLDRRPNQPTLQTTPVAASRQSRTAQRAPSPKPPHQHQNQVPPAAQVRGGQAKPSGHWKEHRGKHGTGPPVSSGGRRVITGAPGEGRHLNENTGGEEARGGERDARAGKVAGDMELEQGNLGGRGEGGDHSHQ